MVSLEEAIRYIEYYRAQGYSDSSIAQGLYAQGYTQEMVQEAFNYIAKGNESGKKKNNHILIIILILIVVVAGVFYITNKSDENNNKPNVSITTTTSRIITTTTLKGEKMDQKRINFRNKVKLCDYIDKFNDIVCYPNPYDEFVLGDPVYIFFKPTLTAKKVGNIYKVGFTQSRKFIDPSGNELKEYSGVIIDKEWEVNAEGKYGIPAYNMFETNESMDVGEYTIELTIKDKFSDEQFNIVKKVSLI